ncbi:polyphosphate kinase 1 [uncultured Helicobacter sp.]|uniref:polyphosphate kinase 1 n=1 Tax=uncultured Helicobacter sp. TaxID=175537 RepID=UPI0026182F35|nr:polyphosphate kinase 1 [uncultured Helicobacter sp.]
MERKYFNRELSWIEFNHRVLLQSQDPSLPLLERLKFIAIYAINLDEFYMIRVAGLKKLYQRGIVSVGNDGMSPKDQLQEIEKALREQKRELEQSYAHLHSQLAKNGVQILQYSQLQEQDKLRAREYFFNNLYPVIVPVIVDFIHPFPHLNNLSFGIALKMQTPKQDIRFALIRIPRFFPRFVEIREGVFLLCESLVGEFAECVFEGYKILDWCPFRITRNADFEIEEEEADDFLTLLNEGLKARKRGEIVRLQVGRKEDRSFLQFLQTHIHIKASDIYEYDLPLNLGSLWQIISHRNYSHLLLPPFQPKNTLEPGEQNLFDQIEKKDIILFHPYESFDPVVEFISQASKDPDVLSIRMTLYRVGKDSPIIKSLIEATESKQVSVLVELKARFDEENNLSWVKALEEAGAHVVYGAVGLKVHAKTALVLKKSQESVKGFVHISSGNYNTQSARTYTDISLFSAREEIVSDVIKFFHSLSTGLSSTTHLNTLFMAPAQIKPHILNLIAKEREKGSEGQIIMKMNALVDSEVIDSLYEASRAGVKIELIVRGICALRPKVKNLSENIRVISLVGKYLEHARIYYFRHGGIYFASADMMTRNLERRVELLVPIGDEKIAQRLLAILSLQINDTQGAYELQSDGKYKKILGDGENSQNECEKLKFWTLFD